MGGRFISRDPIRFQAGDINLYRFVGNNPMNGLDPLGLLTATDGLSHFLGGSGTPLSMNFNELSLEGVSGKTFKFYQKKVPENTCGDCKPTNTPVKKKGAYNLKPYNKDQWLLIGNLTLEVEGTLRTKADCTCVFTGKMTAKPDTYDFNPSTHRSLLGELLTSYGRGLGNVWDGKPFQINFNGHTYLTIECEVK